MPRSSHLVPALAAAITGLIAAAVATRAGARHRETAALLHRTLVDLLLNTLSAGDAATERHSRRVADLTDALAAGVIVDDGEHSTLRVAALLHDMGKIDDRFFDILHSCEPLSDTDRERISDHPRQSAGILEPLERVHPGIARIVGAHHECWDGKGYPQGLRGEDIPLEARLISVADVFDAMTQARSYRNAMPFQQALEEIERGAGSRFDPRVVERTRDPQVVKRWREILEEGRREEARRPAISGSPARSDPTAPR